MEHKDTFLSRVFHRFFEGKALPKQATDLFDAVRAIDMGDRGDARRVLVYDGKHMESAEDKRGDTTHTFHFDQASMKPTAAEGGVGGTADPDRRRKEWLDTEAKARDTCAADTVVLLKISEDEGGVDAFYIYAYLLHDVPDDMALSTVKGRKKYLALMSKEKLSKTVERPDAMLKADTGPDMTSSEHMRLTRVVEQSVPDGGTRHLPACDIRTAMRLAGFNLAGPSNPRKTVAEPLPVPPPVVEEEEPVKKKAKKNKAVPVPSVDLSKDERARAMVRYQTALFKEVDHQVRRKLVTTATVSTTQAETCPWIKFDLTSKRARTFPPTTGGRNFSLDFGVEEGVWTDVVRGPLVDANKVAALLQVLEDPTCATLGDPEHIDLLLNAAVVTGASDRIFQNAFAALLPDHGMIEAQHTNETARALLFGINMGGDPDKEDMIRLHMGALYNAQAIVRAYQATCLKGVHSFESGKLPLVELIFALSCIAVAANPVSSIELANAAHDLKDMVDVITGQPLAIPTMAPGAPQIVHVFRAYVPSGPHEMRWILLAFRHATELPLRVPPSSGHKLSSKVVPNPSTPVMLGDMDWRKWDQTPAVPDARRLKGAFNASWFLRPCPWLARAVHWPTDKEKDE